MLQEFEQKAIYLGIVKGMITRTVTADTPKAVLREYELPNGSKGSKWELCYKAITGYIADVGFRESDFGNQFWIKIDDGKDKYILSMPEDSRYFFDFAQKFSNIKPSELTTLSPFDFDDDAGKFRRGISITQNGEKVKNFFYDSIEKKNINGIIEPENGGKGFDKDDWKIYFTRLKKFLKNHVQNQSSFLGEFNIEEKQPDKMVMYSDELDGMPENLPHEDNLPF